MAGKTYNALTAESPWGTQDRNAPTFGDYMAMVPPRYDGPPVETDEEEGDPGGNHSGWDETYRLRKWRDGQPELPQTGRVLDSLKSAYDPVQKSRDMRDAANNRENYYGNWNAAKRDLKLTPQENELYRRHLTNLHGKGGVDNPDGSRSTLYAGPAQVDDKFYMIPTVYEGRILPSREAMDLAAAGGWDKFPAYASREEADARYHQMHGYMERDTAKYLRGRR